MGANQSIASCWSGRGPRQVIQENNMDTSRPPAAATVATSGVGAGAAIIIPADLLKFKDAAPLPLPLPSNNKNIVSARSLAVPSSYSSNSSSSLFDDDDIMVSPIAYPVTVSLRLRRMRPGAATAAGVDHTNIVPEVRVHIIINDIIGASLPSSRNTANVVNVAVPKVDALSPSPSPSSSVVSFTNDVESKDTSPVSSSSSLLLDVANMAVESQSEQRRAAEDGASILLSYIGQQWPNQKLLDGWVNTCYQPLPAPNQSDTKFRVDCVLPASPREVMDALRTWSPHTNRVKWDAAIQSYQDIDIIDDNTRVIAACTKPVSAGFAQVESREFIDLSLCRQLTRAERQTIVDSLPPSAEAIPTGEWWLSAVRADKSSSSREVSPLCVRATNYPNGVVIYPAANGSSRVILVVYSELQLGWKKSFLRSTMPSELKTMMTRLRTYLQAQSGSVAPVASISTPSLPPTASTSAGAGGAGSAGRAGGDGVAITPVSSFAISPSVSAPAAIASNGVATVTPIVPIAA